MKPQQSKVVGRGKWATLPSLSACDCVRIIFLDYQSKFINLSSIIDVCLDIRGKEEPIPIILR